MSEEIEEWRPVVGYEDCYVVSNTGRVKAIPRIVKCNRGFFHRGEKELGVHRLPKGYLYVGLVHADYSKPRKIKQHYVHRLVAAAFIGHPPVGCEVNHINCDKNDNRPSNLEYITRKENMQHAHRNGLIRSPRGEMGGNAKIKETDAIKICEMLACGLGTFAIAKMTGYTVCTIEPIKQNRTWKHLPREFEWQRTAATALETMSTTLGSRCTTPTSKALVDNSLIRPGRASTAARSRCNTEAARPSGR